MFNLKNKTFYFLLISTHWLATVMSDCSLRILEGNPSFTKNFGRRILELPSVGNLPLKIGEKINVHCSTGMSLRTNYDSSLHYPNTIFNVAIQCRSRNGFVYEVLDTPTYSRDEVSGSVMYINCNNGARQLFESKKSLKGCENYTSLGVGTVLEEKQQAVAAGICFDFETLSTKYVKYLAYRSKFALLFENKSNHSETHITDLDIPIDNLEVFFNNVGGKDFDIGFDEKQKTNVFLGAHEFEFLNIVQDTKLQDVTQQFDYMLKIVWWRNFRLGSWKIFLNALQKRTETVKYILYTGTSGKLVIPSTTNCNQSEVFKIKDTFNAPEIVWAYVKPVKEDKYDEFVVFGYNTPFYIADKRTISCKDICNEIEWLYKDSFNRIRLLPSFGVMHCCRPQDVANQLDTFPGDKMTPMSTITEVPALMEPTINEIKNK